MTPADLHAALVARVQERLALAQAATPGPWTAERQRPDRAVYIVQAAHRLRGIPAMAIDQRADAELMAANDPAFVVRMCTAALKRLDRHRPRPVLDFHELAPCTCSPQAGPTVLWTRCPDVRDEADVWEVDIDD